ncbi:MAG TPA: dTMP kinase, partial [Bacteroidota bacterium]|nr:dTMP kinase [Bacteroidota bacterium]
ISERIRTLLLDRGHDEMTATTELLLFSASRAQLVAEVIRPALQRGEMVVCDRYCDSTTAYQGYGRGLNLDAVAVINRFATMGTMPALTFLLDIPLEEIERRKIAAGMTFDRMESAGRAFYERVRQGYRTLADAEPQRWLVLDGRRPVHELEQDIWMAVEQRLSTAVAPSVRANTTT